MSGIVLYPLLLSIICVLGAACSYISKLQVAAAQLVRRGADHCLELLLLLSGEDIHNILLVLYQGVALEVAVEADIVIDRVLGVPGLRAGLRAVNVEVCGLLAWQACGADALEVLEDLVIGGSIVIVLGAEQADLRLLHIGLRLL